jgi:hypothetical protein
LEVEIDRHGDFVPGVEEGDHLIAFVEGVISKENLECSSNTISLHFPKKPALFAFDAVHQPRNVMNVALVGLDFRVLGVEEGAQLSVEGPELVLVEFPGQLVQGLRCFKVLDNIIRADRIVVQNIRSDLLDGPQVNLVYEEQVLYALWMVKHPSTVFLLIHIKLFAGLEPGPHCGLRGNVFVHH